MTVQNKRLISILLLAPLLLLIPLITMQFTEQVNWVLSDFIIMGLLLLSTGLIVELVLRKVKKVKPRLILIIVVLMVLFLIWAELAVGIFGTPFAGS